MSDRIRKGAFRTFRWATTMWAYWFPIYREPVSGIRYFCQNAGSCGSMYIIELLRRNGFARCHHEYSPALDDLGIRHFEGRVSHERLKSLLIRSRRNIFFEANNRLFSMSRELKEVFPDARFIHLHRDARDVIPSSLSKPKALTWESGRLRYECQKLCGPRQASILERSSRYWANYNDRIFKDLEGLDHLSLKFDDLIDGKLDALMAFIGQTLSVDRIDPVNANKPVRKKGTYPVFDQWPEADQDMLLQICGPTLKKLGYELGKH